MYFVLRLSFCVRKTPKTFELILCLHVLNICFIFSHLIYLFKIFTVDSQCESGPDIAFILDGSGSIGLSYWDIQRFVGAVTEKILMKCTKLNAAIVLFGEGASVVKNFSQKFNLSEFLSALHDAVPIPYSRSMTHKGLRVTSEKVFPFSRKNASKIAILITDGIQTPPHNPFEAAQKLKEQGVRLFAFGIGSYVDPVELRQLTERGEDLIFVDDFFNLYSWVDFLVRKVITAVGKTICAY